MKYRKTISGNLETLKQLHKLLGEAIKHETDYRKTVPCGPIVGHTSESETEYLMVVVNPNQKDLTFSGKVEFDLEDEFYQDLSDSEW